jgi:hypothetical protein
MVPKKLILISDPRILKIPIEENHDSIVDFREMGLFVDPRKDLQKRGGDQQFYSKARKIIASKLLDAQSYLPVGIKFLIIEGLRPLSLQRDYFEGYSRELISLHPDWSKEKIYQEASKYVSPPEITPPHSTASKLFTGWYKISDH